MFYIKGCHVTHSFKYYFNYEVATLNFTGGQTMTKFIFVTGGVVSSLGKGITAASLGRLLKDRGLKVTIQNLIHI